MPSINQEDIKKSLKLCKESNIFNRLDNIYKLVPIGKCNGCANCCMESVNTSFVEFLNILNYLQTNKDIYEKFFPKIIKYYFLEMVEKMHCPFLDEEKRCIIYEKRPLVCRAFGNIPKKDHERNYESVLESNMSISKYLKENYDINISDDIVKYKIKFCENFKATRPYNKKNRGEIFDNIFSMESMFLMNGIIDESFLEIGLISWFAYMIFDIETLDELRIKVMKEYLDKKHSQTLDDILKDIILQKF